MAFFFFSAGDTFKNVPFTKSERQLIKDSLFLIDPSLGRNCFPRDCLCACILEAQPRFMPSKESYTLWFLNYKWEIHTVLE